MMIHCYGIRGMDITAAGFHGRSFLYLEICGSRRQRYREWHMVIWRRVTILQGWEQSSGVKLSHLNLRLFAI